MKILGTLYIVCYVTFVIIGDVCVDTIVIMQLYLITLYSSSHYIGFSPQELHLKRSLERTQCRSTAVNMLNCFLFCVYLYVTRNERERRIYSNACVRTHVRRASYK